MYVNVCKRMFRNQPKKFEPEIPVYLVSYTNKKETLNAQVLQP